MIERDIALIDELLSNNGENECLELKHNNSNPDVIGKLCSALSNSARVNNQDLAYVIWGVDDSTRQVVGTTFCPFRETVGNEVLEFWLSKKLSPTVPITFRTVEHPRGRVVVLEIPAATPKPIEFGGIAYIRIGSATPKLSDFPQHFQKLIDNLRPYAWEKGIAKAFLSDDEVLNFLDYPSYFQLTKQRLPDNRQGIFSHLEADRLIKKDIADKWAITNLGAILIAKDLQQFDSALSRKCVRFIAYEGSNKASKVYQRLDGRKGYASGFEGLVTFINNLLPKNEHIGRAFREEHPLFPELAIRELIANALIHQDMTIQGAGPQIELFNNRLEITNPGTPLVHIERMIDLPPRSRNEALASLMRRMNLCEEQGSGLDKVIIEVELFQLPAPKFQDGANSFQAILYGPRTFTNMTTPERVRACYQHSIIKYLSGERMKNASLCERFGLNTKNAAQATKVINATLKEQKIKVADPEHPRAGYLPIWA